MRRARCTPASVLGAALATLCACRAPAAQPAPKPQPTAPVIVEPTPAPPPSAASPKAVSAARSAKPYVVFRGMCDASGAVVLDETHFAVADDEDNVLRIYDGVRGGEPVRSVDVSSALNLPVKKKVPEADIEAATRVGDRALWLTSHGLSSSGKLQPGRFRFFATTASSQGSGVTPVGVPYQSLLQDMLAAPQLARFGLAAAAQLAPKAPGGLNIEGMTRRADGTSVLIGFRNPVPDDKALVIPLLNPLACTNGQAAQIGEPSLLDLGGRGVRSLTYWRGRYLIMAGSPGDEHRAQLFVWDGAGALHGLPALDLSDINPEAFVSRDQLDEVMLLSDDGTVEVEGVPCKKLKDPAKKQFRGLWVRVES